MFHPERRRSGRLGRSLALPGIALPGIALPGIALLLSVALYWYYVFEEGGWNFDGKWIRK
jgi:hypothetical protein